MTAFRLTAEQAELFFQICDEGNLKTEEERVYLLSLMANLGLVQSVVESPKTKEEYIQHMAKHFTCAIIKNKDDAQQGDTQNG